MENQLLPLRAQTPVSWADGHAAFHGWPHELAETTESCWRWSERCGAEQKPDGCTGESWSVGDAAVIGALHPDILSDPVSARAPPHGPSVSDATPHPLSRLGDGGSTLPDSDGSTRPAVFEGERLRLEESTQVPWRAWVGTVRRCLRKSLVALPSV